MPVTESSIQLTNLFRYHNGTRGFLECHELVDKLAFEQFDRVLGQNFPTFALVVQNLLDMGKFSTAAEIQVREHQKLEIIGRFYGPGHYSGLAVDFNDASIRAARRARYFLQKAREQIDDPSVALRDTFAKAETRASLQEARGLVARELVELNVTTEEFRELLKIWDEMIAESGDTEKLFKYLDKNIESFISLRQEPGRGTQPHSPLPWWKWFLIASLWCAVATALAACYIYFECTYLEGLIFWTIVGVTAIIMSGC